jgi:hypothetical protein
MKISKAQSIENKRRVWDLKLKCYTRDEIAEELGMKPNTVKQILHRLTKHFKQSLTEDIEEIKNDQIASLCKIAREAFEAWEVSKKSVKKLRDKSGTAPNGAKITEKSKETCYQDIDSPTGQQLENDVSLLKMAGDPRHLKIAMEALADIRAITGANAPIKSDVSLTNLSDEELLSEAAKILGEEQAKQILSKP